jgi:hypothetical protein
LSEIKRLTAINAFDYVVYNTGKIDPANLKPTEEPVKTPANFADETYELIGLDLVDSEPVPSTPGDEIANIRSSFRHNKRQLAEAIEKILNKVDE